MKELSGKKTTVSNPLALKDPRDGVIGKEIENIPAFRKEGFLLPAAKKEADEKREAEEK